MALLQCHLNPGMRVSARAHQIATPLIPDEEIISANSDPISGSPTPIGLSQKGNWGRAIIY